MGENHEAEIPSSMPLIMVYEDNRLKTFTDSNKWPYIDVECNCTPDKMAAAGFYWCGSDSSPDMVRCFVCLKEFDCWDENDDPRAEHKRLCPQCPFIILGKPQNKCTVKEIMELCTKSLERLIEKRANHQVDVYSSKTSEIRNQLIQLSDQNALDL